MVHKIDQHRIAPLADLKEELRKDCCRNEILLLDRIVAGELRSKAESAVDNSLAAAGMALAAADNKEADIAVAAHKVGAESAADIAKYFAEHNSD